MCIFFLCRSQSGSRSGGYGKGSEGFDQDNPGYKPHFVTLHCTVNDALTFQFLLNRDFTMKAINSYFWPPKSCSCHFGTLFWDDITIFCYENQVNKLLIGLKLGFFSVKNHNKVS